MTERQAFLAVDWGTTNRRVFRIEGGTVTATDRDACGVIAMRERSYPDDVAALRATHGDLPVLIAGMAGSNIGWREVPYVPAPASLANVAAGIAWIDERTAIVPGVRSSDDAPPDVMRGEEVQVLGAVAAGLAPEDALLCQPGTHCKWVTMKGGAIAAFRTAMTGEVFATIRQHGLLAPQLGGEVALGEVFDAGVREGGRGDLLASLFGIRAAGVLGTRPAAKAASFASGLLIGADVAAQLARSNEDVVHLLADPALAALYARAIALGGRKAVTIDSHRAFVAGITRIWSLT